MLYDSTSQRPLFFSGWLDLLEGLLAVLYFHDLAFGYKAWFYIFCLFDHFCFDANLDLLHGHKNHPSIVFETHFSKIRGLVWIVA